MPLSTHPAMRTVSPGSELKDIVEALHAGYTLESVMPRLEPLMLHHLRCERIAIFARTRYSKSLKAIQKTGSDLAGGIEVPLASLSIVGFCGLHTKAVVLRDAYDESELRRTHPDLRFDTSFDKLSGFRTRSVLAIPIMFGAALLGVLQAINRRDGATFDKHDMIAASDLSRALAVKFRYDFQATSGPLQYLVHRKRLSAEDAVSLEQQAETAGTPVADLAVQGGDLSEVEVGESLARYHQVPFMLFEDHIAAPSDLIEKLGAARLAEEGWVPVEVDAAAGSATLLMENPSDTKLISRIEEAMGSQRFELRVGLRSSILEYLGLVDRAPAITRTFEQLVESASPVEGPKRSVLSLDGNNAVDLVSFLLRKAAESGASDIHIEPSANRNPATVRLRIDGLCYPRWTIPDNLIPSVISRIKVLSKLDISERRRPQDGKCKFQLRDRTIELRVATLPTVNGEAAVLRVLASASLLTVDKLGLSERNKSALLRSASSPHGILIVVGPTGSGKTTTLHSVMGHINTPDRKIWTVEDPVEINHPGLCQLQVNPKAGISFATALRAFLRADPDIIMVGEMRDAETAQAAVEAAMTGHLVLSTLHTNTAPETILRLLSMGLDVGAFAESLRGVLSQRLARRLCRECRRPEALTVEVAEAIKVTYGVDYADELDLRPGKSVLYEAAGCSSCEHTGYAGRLALHEFLEASPAIREIIQSGATIGKLRQTAMDGGMRLLVQDGLHKVLAGITSLSEIHRVASG